MLFGFGSNNHGQLGIGEVPEGDNAFSATPKTIKVKGLDWKAVACGMFHSAALTGTGELYTWGSNEEGQLGHKLKRKEEGLDTPTLLKCPAGKREHISAVACGNRHTILLDSKGTAWTFGETEDGKLGVKVGKEESKVTPQHVKLPTKNVAVRGIAAGNNHTFLWTDSDAWVCGCNNTGQLGLANDDELVETTFKAIPWFAGKAIEHASLGDGHTAVILADGTLVTFGSARNDRLGHKSDSPAVFEPTAVEWLSTKIRAELVSCGGQTTFVLGSVKNTAFVDAPQSSPKLRPLEILSPNQPGDSSQEATESPPTPTTPKLFIEEPESLGNTDTESDDEISHNRSPLARQTSITSLKLCDRDVTPSPVPEECPSDSGDNVSQSDSEDDVPGLTTKLPQAEGRPVPPPIRQRPSPPAENCSVTTSPGESPVPKPRAAGPLRPLPSPRNPASTQSTPQEAETPASTRSARSDDWARRSARRASWRQSRVLSPSVLPPIVTRANAPAVDYGEGDAPLSPLTTLKMKSFDSSDDSESDDGRPPVVPPRPPTRTTPSSIGYSDASFESGSSEESEKEDDDPAKAVDSRDSDLESPVPAPRVRSSPQPKSPSRHQQQHHAANHEKHGDDNDGSGDSSSDEDESEDDSDESGEDLSDDESPTTENPTDNAPIEEKGSDPDSPRKSPSWFGSSRKRKDKKNKDTRGGEQSKSPTTDAGDDGGAANSNANADADADTRAPARRKKARKSKETKSGLCVLL